ncbi:Mut7-C RNAse domain-containing protein [Halobacterium bonnevillei]|uniref:Mut7-C RNAse domain-containing protein n=1 Tax=Halobacterium bonnevillei TaxID=2692200 RepID=A0A6B0SK97_9EURY|nr:Mut7-C RNAse domain-containing protein [Halobacterium bonnevillei]MXR22234.1 hypothetical protein [Halobacterium bonnevillei]
MRFLLDAMLGDLARLLRMCGHDAAYALDRGVDADDDLRRLADSEGRVLVTRDRQLAAQASDSVLVTAKDTDEQLRELAADGVDLSLSPGERCGACNGDLARVSKPTALPDYVTDGVDALWRCADCGQYFWRGSHWDDVEARLAEL